MQGAIGEKKEGNKKEKRSRRSCVERQIEVNHAKISRYDSVTVEGRYCASERACLLIASNSEVIPGLLVAEVSNLPTLLRLPLDFGILMDRDVD